MTFVSLIPTTWLYIGIAGRHSLVTIVMAQQVTQLVGAIVWRDGGYHGTSRLPSTAARAATRRACRRNSLTLTPEDQENTNRTGTCMWASYQESSPSAGCCCACGSRITWMAENSSIKSRQTGKILASVRRDKSQEELWTIALPISMRSGGGYRSGHQRKSGIVDPPVPEKPPNDTGGLSITGFDIISQPDRGRVRRIIWLLILLACTTNMIYQVRVLSNKTQLPTSSMSHVTWPWSKLRPRLNTSIWR